MCLCVFGFNVHLATLDVGLLMQPQGGAPALCLCYTIIQPFHSGHESHSDATM